MDWQCQAVALNHKKKTAGRPPDWPEETDSDAEWERLASNEVIWEEMINGSGNVREIDSDVDTLDAEKREEGTLNAGKTSKEITPDTGVTDPSNKMIKIIHGEMVGNDYRTAEKCLYNGYGPQFINRSTAQSEEHDRQRQHP